jgi:hypothetical protein
MYDNNILIDGINAVSAATFGPFMISVPSPDSVQEFKVQTNLYSAEFGRAGGASVNLVTRSGTNKIHGNVFEFIRNENLNANEFFYKASQMASGRGNQAPILRQNQFGGTIGGPIRKDKTFFFFSYQGTRQLNGAAPGLVFANGLYPRLPAGDRSNEATLRAQLGAIYGGRTGFPFGFCDLIPGIPINCILPDGSNINPVAIKILQAKLPNGQYMLPSFAPSSYSDGKGGINGGQVYSEASFSFPSHYDEDQYMVNIDHQISTRHTFSGKFFSSGAFQDTPAGNIGVFFNTARPQNRNLMLTHTWVPNPTLVNEVRAGYMRVNWTTLRNDPIGASDVGMLAPIPNRFPRIAIAMAGLDIGSASYISKLIENQFTISDTVSKVAGQHSLRFGGTFVRHQLNTDGDLIKAGQLILFGFEDFLLGEDAVGNHMNLIFPLSNILSSGAQGGSFEKAYRFNDLSFFVQDDIKLRPNFTVNLGLRWDYFAWPHDIRGRLAGFDRTLIEEGFFGIPPSGGSYTGFTLAEAYHRLYPNHPIPTGVTLLSDTLLKGADLNNFAPRVGFAWQPFKHVSVRGGYGIFYPRSSTEAADVQKIGPPFNKTALTAFTPYGNLQDPFTYLNIPPDSAFPMWEPRTYDYDVAPNFFFRAMDPNTRNPYVQQWNLSLQFEFARDFLLEIGYSGSHGLKLLNTLAGNQPGIASPDHPIRGITTNTNDSLNVAARVPVAGVMADRGLDLTQMTGESKYNALLISVNKRMSHGLQFLSSFTFGRNSDNNSLNSTDCGLAGCVGNAEPPGDNNYNNHWGLTDWDHKVRSTTTFVYELPNLMKNQGALLRKTFGGWQMAAVMTFQSGTPITFAIMQNYSAVKLQGYLTPNMKAGKTLGDIQGSGPIHDRLNGYFASPGTGSAPGQEPAGTVFAWPGPLDYGHLGRSLPIRTPGQKSIDFALSKRTAIRENTNLEFRAEFFNFFNWVNFGYPDSAVSSPSFGWIRSTTVAPRIIQFALKLNF